MAVPANIAAAAEAAAQAEPASEAPVAVRVGQAAGKTQVTPKPAVDLHSATSRTGPPTPKQPVGVRDTAFRVLSDTLLHIEKRIPTVTPVERHGLLYQVMQTSVTEGVLYRSRATNAGAPAEEAAACAWVGDRLLKIAASMIPGVRLEVKSKVVKHNPGDLAREFRAYHEVRLEEYEATVLARLERERAQQAATAPEPEPEPEAEPEVTPAGSEPDA